MVVIQCPHCYEDVELENEASGLFDCPLCNNEFEYGSKPAKVEYYSSDEPKLSKKTKTVLILIIISLMFVLVGSIYFNKAISDYNDSGIDCGSSESTTGGDSVPGNPFSLEFWGIDDCSSEGDYGASSVCCSIILMLVGVCFGISAFVSLLTGIVRGDKKVMIVRKET